MEKKLRILTMMHKIDRGGFYERYLALIKGMLDKGYDVHYLCSHEFDMKHENLHFHKVFAFSFIPLNLFFKLFAQFYFLSYIICKLYKVDKIVLFGEGYSAAASLSKKRLGVPVITFMRADPIEAFEIQNRKISVWLGKRLERLGFETSSKIIVNSECLGEKLVRRNSFIKRKLRYLPNNIKKEYQISAKEAHQYYPLNFAE